MRQFSYKVNDKLGIHARPANALAKMAKKYECRIELKKGDEGVDMKKMMAMMKMNIHCGEAVQVILEGTDEDTAYSEVSEYFQNNI